MMVEKSVAPKQDQKVREVLIRAGIELIAEKGYDGASISDIASKAEVTKGAVYYHFGSKEDFVLEIIQQRAMHNIGRFKERQGKPISLAQWIKTSFAMIMGFPDPAQQQFSLHVMMAGMRPEYERIGNLIAELHKQWRGLIAEMVTQSIEYREGNVTADPEIIAVGIMALVDGLLIHSRLESQIFTEDAFIERLEPLLELWIMQNPVEE
ncbi:MAG: TetR/AcrR family transcriptional regulator [Aggregatilineales bacterium]